MGEIIDVPNPTELLMNQQDVITRLLGGWHPDDVDTDRPFWYRPLEDWEPGTGDPLVEPMTEGEARIVRFSEDR